ncbi:MAG: hypothetical protein U9Q15_05410 [Patescibacteria group bacterium]|nr:hypothetical protein [Patescibacteria group bacterium]
MQNISKLYVMEGPGSFAGIRSMQILVSTFLSLFPEKEVHISLYSEDLDLAKFTKQTHPNLDYHKEPRIG